MTSWEGNTSLRTSVTSNRRIFPDMEFSLIMRTRLSLLLSFACVIFPLAGQTGAPDPAADPKDATAWFQRASDRLNLRTFDAAPFHMKVTFTALPGLELLPKNQKPEIITGDGTYEETWLAPHHWRREVTLGDYHAVEVESQKGRKMQASSDYEPSRVLMLLDALFYPIHRDRISPDLDRRHLRWTIERKTAADLPFVLVSAAIDEDEGYKPAYIFLPNGLLVQSNDDCLAASWQDDATFAGHVVPRKLMIQAGGHTLLTAQIAVHAAGQVDPAVFELPGETAEPGMTLRPLHDFEVEGPGLSSDCTFIDNPENPMLPLGIRRIIDRRGATQEVEILDSRNLAVKARSDTAAFILDCYRRKKRDTATIDKSPAQLPMLLYFRYKFVHR
jgi:hypothetical protein